MKLVPFLLCVCAGLTAARGATVTVGNPQDGANLPVALAAAYAQGARDITIAPGVYDLPSINHRDTILLTQWRDATVHAAGATLIFEELKRCPVHLDRCANVTWDGGTLRFAQPSSTQGRVTTKGADARGDYFDWKVDAGYAKDLGAGKKTFVVVDQATRQLKVNTGDIVYFPSTAMPPAVVTGVSREQTAPGEFRLHAPAKIAAMVAVGDWLVTADPAGGSNIFHLDDCQTCAVENVTLQNGGFATLFETRGAGANRYLHCTIEPGPRPTGATEDQLVGGGSDGFHSVDMETGPDLEDCVFHGVFLDDCIAIQGTFGRVIATSGNDVTLGSNRPLPRVGDPLRILNRQGFFAQAICRVVTPQTDGTLRVTLDQALDIPINHTEDADPRAGTKASDPFFCGRGYIIRNCRLGDTRSRGILVKGDDGVIENCTIENCGMSGVSIGPEFYWNEAGYSWNVTVSHNKFIGCDENNTDQSAIWVHGEGAIGNRNIMIADNDFVSSYGSSVVRCNWVDGVEIKGNRFAASFQIPGRVPGQIVSLLQCRHVKLLDNLVSDQGATAGALVGLDKSVPPAEVENNDATGIRIETAKTP
jgi:hypothetical protein